MNNNYIDCLLVANCLPDSQAQPYPRAIVLIDFYVLPIPYRLFPLGYSHTHCEEGKAWANHQRLFKCGCFVVA